MLNLNSVMVGTKQSEAMIAFYEKVLGKAPDMVDRENGFAGWQVGSANFSVTPFPSFPQIEVQI